MSFRGTWHYANASFKIPGALIRRRWRHLPHRGGRLSFAVRTWQDACFGVRNRGLQPVGTSHRKFVGNDPCVVPRCLALYKRKFQNTGRSHPSLTRHLPSQGKAFAKLAAPCSELFRSHPSAKAATFPPEGRLPLRPANVLQSALEYWWYVRK